MGKFKPGDRVVCVNSEGGLWLGKGDVYTVDYIPAIGFVRLTANNIDWCDSRFKLAPTTQSEPQCQKLNTPITEAVAKVYEAVLTVPEEHRSSILRAVLELL